MWARGVGRRNWGREGVRGARGGELSEGVKGDGMERA